MSRFDRNYDEICSLTADIENRLIEPTKLEETYAKCLVNVRQTQEEMVKVELEVGTEAMKDFQKYESKCNEKRTKLSTGTEIEREIEQIRIKLEHFTDCQSTIQKKQQTSKEILSNLASKREELKGEMKQREVIVEEHKKLKNDFRLFNDITHMTMDIAKNPYLCKGYISKKTEVKTFELNREESSMFLITNHLWELIGD